MAPTRRAPLRGERHWRGAAPSEVIDYLELQGRVAPSGGRPARPYLDISHFGGAGSFTEPGCHRDSHWLSHFLTPGVCALFSLAREMRSNLIGWRSQFDWLIFTFNSAGGGKHHKQ